MSFRVTATVEKTSPTGKKYAFMLYCGEFRDDETSPEEALSFAATRTRELFPDIAAPTLEFEDLPDPRSIH